jgi:hypothetical protein
MLLDSLIWFLSSFAGILVFVLYVASVFVDGEVRAFIKNPLTADVFKVVLLPITLPAVQVQKGYNRLRK